MTGGGGHIRHPHFTVRSLHFQLSDFFGQFTPFSLELAFEVVPILAWTWTFGQYGNDVDHRDIPLFSFGVPYRTDLLLFKELCFVLCRHGVGDVESGRLFVVDEVAPGGEPEVAARLQVCRGLRPQFVVEAREVRVGKFQVGVIAREVKKADHHPLPQLSLDG